MPPRLRTLSRAAAIAFLIAITLWGLRLTILEGFVYEWPRAFGGDFKAAMFDVDWWDGTGIMYGPVFVIEHWFVNAWPHVFTVYFFALANIPAMVLAFVLASSAARSSRTAIFVSLTAWLCFRWFYQAFSVAANPEILEVLFLTLAWYAASRAKPSAAWMAWVVAVLTKVIPAIFAPLLLMRASRRAIVLGAATGLALMVAVGIGQRLSPKDLVLDIVIPTQNVGNGQGNRRQSEHIEPLPSADIARGLNSALARAFRMTEGDPSISRIQTASNVVTLLVYLSSLLVALRLLRGQHGLPEITRLTLSYGLFFALLPLLTFHTHRHTFVFLVPVWTAIIATLVEDTARLRMALFSVLFLLIYVQIGLPAAIVPVDRLMRTRYASSWLFDDPIWGNLTLILVLSVYAVMRTYDRQAIPGPGTV